MRLADWRHRREEYNERRPHSSLGYLTPSEFAAIVPNLYSHKTWYRKWGQVSRNTGRHTDLEFAEQPSSLIAVDRIQRSRTAHKRRQTRCSAKVRNVSI